MLFIMISIGFLCNKTRLLKQETVDDMTDLVFYVISPCIIIISFQRPFNPQLLGSLGIAFLIGVVYHLINIFFAHLLVHDSVDARRRVLRFSLVFSNAGFMGIPLQRALLGDEGVFYGAAVIAVFTLVVWSYGLVLMSGKGQSTNMRQVILNPGVIAVGIGLLFFVGSVKLYSVIAEPMRVFGDMNTPIPMLIIGYYLADARLGHVLKSLRVHFVVFLRLILVPLILLALILMSGIYDETLVVACIIAASAPTAAMTTMFAAKFKQDTLLSVGIVSYSTLVSIITMPVVVGLARYLTQ